MKLEDIEKAYNAASEEYKFLGKDQQLATWAMMNGSELLAVAKAARAWKHARLMNQPSDQGSINILERVIDEALEELEKE